MMEVKKWKEMEEARLRKTKAACFFLMHGR
jgi:hypothetical protein